MSTEEPTEADGGLSGLTDVLCGCGRPVRYQTQSGYACNKYARCQPKRCIPCRETGLAHCSDPENCGGPWDTHNAKVQAAPRSGVETGTES